MGTTTTQSPIAKRLKSRLCKQKIQTDSQIKKKQRQYQLLESLISSYEKQYCINKLSYNLCNDISTWDDNVLNMFQYHSNKVMDYMFHVQDEQVRYKRKKISNSSSSSNVINKNNNIPTIPPLSTLLSSTTTTTTTTTSQSIQQNKKTTTSINHIIGTTT